MQKENKLTKDRMVWSNSQVKEGRWELDFTEKNAKENLIYILDCASKNTTH